MSAQTLVQYDEKPPVDINTLTTEEKKELITEDAVSILSTTTLGSSDLGFVSAKSLHISTKGVPALRLPLPPKELETIILNFDGSLAYASTRGKRNSGNCVLTDADGKALIKTEYFFGPNKTPVLNRLDIPEGISSEIKTVSKWTSRSHEFLLPDNRVIKWEYQKQKGFGADGAKGTALVLMLGDKRLAALIRNGDTRTSGSKSCSAGNGGELVLGENIGGKEGVNEDLVIATCLLMLKKEIDRRRVVQMMMIAAAVSGGGP